MSSDSEQQESRVRRLPEFTSYDDVAVFVEQEKKFWLIRF